MQRRVVTTRASRVRASRDADGGRRRTVGGRSGGDRNRGACGTRINHYQIRMSVFTPARRLPHRTAYYYVVSRPVSLGLSREVRGSHTHTHARTHRGTMPTQHDTHLHPSRPAHIASRMHHHSLHGRLPRTPTDPCTHPAAPHTRDAHGHITVIHTLPTPHRRAYQSFTCAEWPPHGSTCVAREHASNIQTQRPNENERRTPPVFFESKESDRRIPLPALTFGCWM